MCVGVEFMIYLVMLNGYQSWNEYTVFLSFFIRYNIVMLKLMSSHFRVL